MKTPFKLEDQILKEQSSVLKGTGKLEFDSDIAEAFSKEIYTHAPLRLGDRNVF